MAIMGTLFFFFGMISWVNSVLIPYFKVTCELSLAQAYLVGFVFYIAYLVMAIPSSMMLDAVGYKRGISYGLFVMALGALCFVPAALTRLLCAVSCRAVPARDRVGCFADGRQSVRDGDRANGVGGQTDERYGRM